MPITFPVSKDSRFVAYRKSDNAILKKGIRWPNEEGSPINGLDPLIAMAIMVKGADPPFNPDTHKLVKTETLLPFVSEFRITNVAAPLTQAELDARVAEQQNANRETQIRNAMAALRNGTGTAAERLARVEKACVHLLRNLMRIE